MPLCFIELFTEQPGGVRLEFGRGSAKETTFISVTQTFHSQGQFVDCWTWGVQFELK